MRIVITGGPGFGKTALLQEMADREFSIVPEHTRQLIKTYHDQELDINQHRAQLNNAICKKRCEDFLNNQNHIFDRGLPDEFAFYWAHNISIPYEYIRFANNHKYDAVFVTPPWKEIYTQDSERQETFMQAKHIHSLILDAYVFLGYRPIHLPKCSIARRAKIMSDAIQTKIL